MKAVVLEVRGKEAVVLTTDGEIIKIRQKNLTTGDTIELSEKQAKGKVISYRGILRYGSVAAAAALILGSGGLYSYNNVVACSYVSLDIEPSIEYTLNRKNLVLDVTALNDKATEIVQDLKDAGIKKNTLSEAMEMTAQLLEKYGYLDTDATDYVLINVSSDDEKMRELLKEEANTVFDNINTDNTENVNVTVTESSVSDRKNAKSLGISSGEYQEIQRIKENETADSKPEISADDIDKYSGLGVRELLETSGQLEKKEEPAQQTSSAGSAKQTQSNEGEKQQQNSGPSGDSTNAGQQKSDSEKQTKSNSGNDAGKGSDKDNSSSGNTENENASPAADQNSGKNTTDNKENQSQPDSQSQSDSQSQGNETTQRDKTVQDNNTPQPDSTNEASTQTAPQSGSGAPTPNSESSQPAPGNPGGSEDFHG